MESEYSLWPYLEARSLGDETTLSEEGAEPARSAIERMLGHLLSRTPGLSPSRQISLETGADPVHSLLLTLR
jgi:hypothetical protein